MVRKPSRFAYQAASFALQGRVMSGISDTLSGGFFHKNVMIIRGLVIYFVIPGFFVYIAS